MIIIETKHFRYKRALHAKRRELEKKRAELLGDDEQGEIEHSSDEQPNNNIIEELSSSDSDNIHETIEKSSKEKKLSWDFGNIENLPGCSTALQHLETLPAKSVKKKD